MKINRAILSLLWQVSLQVKGILETETDASRKDNEKTHRGNTAMWLEWRIHKSMNAKRWQQTPEAGGGIAWFSSGAVQESLALQIPWLQSSSCQNCESTSFALGHPGFLVLWHCSIRKHTGTLWAHKPKSFCRKMMTCLAAQSPSYCKQNSRNKSLVLLTTNLGLPLPLWRMTDWQFSNLNFIKVCFFKLSYLETFVKTENKF